jgi:hypothetical protein
VQGFGGARQIAAAGGSGEPLQCVQRRSTHRGSRSDPSLDSSFDPDSARLEFHSILPCKIVAFRGIRLTLS